MSKVVDQNQIVSWLRDLAPEINSSGDPKSVLVKFASSQNMAPELLGQMGKAFNAWSTHSNFSRVKEASHRGDTIPLLDIEEMMKEYQSFNKEASYIKPISDMSKKASTSKVVLSKINRDLITSQSKIDDVTIAYKQASTPNALPVNHNADLLELQSKVAGYDAISYKYNKIVKHASMFIASKIYNNKDFEKVASFAKSFVINPEQVMDCIAENIKAFEPSMKTASAFDGKRLLTNEESSIVDSLKKMEESLTVLDFCMKENLDCAEKIAAIKHSDGKTNDIIEVLMQKAGSAAGVDPNVRIKELEKENRRLAEERRDLLKDIANVSADRDDLKKKYEDRQAEQAFRAQEAEKQRDFQRERSEAEALIKQKEKAGDKEFKRQEFAANALMKSVDSLKDMANTVRDMAAEINNQYESSYKRFLDATSPERLSELKVQKFTPIDLSALRDKINHNLNVLVATDPVIKGMSKIQLKDALGSLMAVDRNGITASNIDSLRQFLRTRAFTPGGIDPTAMKTIAEVAKNVKQSI